MKLKLIKRQSETADVESFFWQSETQLDFKPGQYLKWNLSDDNPDDRGNGRFFSISSSPTEDLIMNTTKFNTERPSTFKATLKNMVIGDTITAFGPLGSFLLPKQPAQPLVFIAGGIGITPFRSMIKFVADNRLNYQTQLLYSCRTPADIAFREVLDELATAHDWLQLIYVAETPDDAWRGETGRLDAERIKQLVGGLDGKKTYLSGPEPMVKAFKDGLVAGGVSEDSMMTDYFPGYGAS